MMKMRKQVAVAREQLPLNTLLVMEDPVRKGKDEGTHTHTHALHPHLFNVTI